MAFAAHLTGGGSRDDDSPRVDDVALGVVLVTLHLALAALARRAAVRVRVALDHAVVATLLHKPQQRYITSDDDTPQNDSIGTNSSMQLKCRYGLV